MTHAPQLRNFLIDFPIWLTSVQSLGIADPIGQATCCGGDNLTEQWLTSGLRPGGVVFIALPNSTALLAHMHAVVAAGGVPALLSPSTPHARLHELVAALGPSALLTARPLPKWPATKTTTVAGSEVVIFEKASSHSTQPGELIILTSGTTGFSSGCVHNLEALLRNASRHLMSIGLRTTDTMLVNLPLYYSFGLVAQAFGAFLAGCRMVLSSGAFGPHHYLSALRDAEATVSSITPRIVRELIRYRGCLAGKANLSSVGIGAPGMFPESLRILTVGGDYLDPEFCRILFNWRPGRELYLTYGLSEAGPRVSTLAVHNEPPARWSSVGLPLPGTEVRISGDRTHDGIAPPRCPSADSSAAIDGSVGELFVRSDTLMKRRIGKVEGRVADWREDGFLATGDVFRMDDAGYLYFQGRLGDFISLGGEKVSLASVRQVACARQGVIAAVTRQARDPANAFQEEGYELTVILSATSGGDSGKIEAEIRRRLRRQEQPAAIHFLVGADPSGTFK